MFSCGVVVFLECLSQPQRAPLGFTERVNGLLYFFFTSEEEVLFLSAVSALSCTTHRVYKKKRYQPEAQLKSRSLVFLREARLPITEVKSLITQNTRIRLSLSLFWDAGL